MSVLELPNPQRVLIIKPSALGDVVTALPVLRALRRKYPEVQIDWLVSTSCAAVLQGDPDTNELVLFERKKLGRCWKSPAAFKALLGFYRQLRRGQYDWVIDLQGLLRSGIFTQWTKAPVRVGFAHAREGATLFYTHKIPIHTQHTVDNNIELARAIGLDAQPEDMMLTVSETAENAIQSLRAKHNVNNTPYLVAVPPTRWETKKYPVRHWRRVVETLSAKCPVFLVGSPAESEQRMCVAIAEGQSDQVVNLTGQTSIPELVALIADSAGVVCSDSAAKFIAPAVGVDCVTLLGPTRVERTGPYRKGKAIIAEIPCQGCLKKRCNHMTCMQSITPEQVVQAAETMIAGGTSCPC